MKQVILREIANQNITGGIQLDDGNILCCCCGAVIQKDEIAAIPNAKITGRNYTHQILQSFDGWIGMDKPILEAAYELYSRYGYGRGLVEIKTNDFESLKDLKDVLDKTKVEYVDGNGLYLLKVPEYAITILDAADAIYEMI